MLNLKVEKKKIGLILYLASAVFIILMSVVGGFYILEPLDKIYAGTATGSQLLWYIVWGFNIFIGGLLASAGIYLYIDEKNSKIAKLVCVIFPPVFIFGFIMKEPGTNWTHIPVIYGILGFTMILLFLGVLWFWGQNRRDLEGVEKDAADLRLIAYMFFMLATWHLCGYFYDILARNFVIRSPYDIPIFLMLGWAFLFLSYWRLTKKAK